MMKVLHVINSFEGGGAEKTVLYLHESYLKQGIDSHAISFMKSSAGNLANTYCLDFENPYSLSVLIKLHAFLSQPEWKDLDIIHSQLFPAQLYIPFLTKIIGLKARLVTTEQTSFNYRRNTLWGKLIDNFLYGFYHKITCVSSHTLKTMYDWMPQMKDKLVVVHNGIDFDKYSSASTSNSEKETPIIVSVGRLVEQKNYETMIRGLSKINSQPFEYWILGTGPLEASLKSLVKELNLEDKVKFFGFRQDIPELLHKADIFMQVSLFEGLSLAMIEAMAAGLPVIVSDIPEATEAVTKDSGAGFVVNSRSENEIAEKLSKLLNDPSLRLNMGKSAQMRAKDFDIKRIVQEYIHLYQAIC